MNARILRQFCIKKLPVAALCLFLVAESQVVAKVQLDAQAFVHQELLPMYGKVLSSQQDVISNALVETVKIYPQGKKDVRNKLERNGLLVRYKDAQATILVCHGFMCDKHDAGLLRRVFPRGKYNVMTFDFRAHGENRSGQLCTFGHDEARDVIAAAKFLRSYAPLQDKPLYVYGFSMGAAASIEAQSHTPLFDAMILDCPFDSSEKVLKRALDSVKLSIFGYEFDIPGKSYLQEKAFHPYIQAFIKVLLKTVAKLDSQNIQMNIRPFSPVESIKNVSVPCFFIHCKNDEKVPLAAGRSVFNGAAGPKKLWITNGRWHFDSYFYNPEKYTDQVRSFLQDVQQGKYQKYVREVIEDNYDITGAGNGYEK